MNINRHISATIKILVFFIAFAACFILAQNILKLKMGHRGTDNVKGFYALSPDTADVLVVGASTAFCTVDPLVLYGREGITAYDFTSSAQPFELTGLFVREALKTQKPKVLAVELLSLFRELDPDDANSLNYGLTDLRFSGEKVRGLYGMFKDDPGLGLAYLIPMVQYKDRWQELTGEDFKPWTDPLTMGAYTPDKIAEEPLDFSEYYEDEEIPDIPDKNRAVLEDIISLCRERNIELLAFKAPNVGWTIGQTRGAAQLCEEYGIPFIDYFALMEELSIDPALDFRDNSHLNITGSAKASAYFADYLKAHYELPDERGTARGSRWQKALENRDRGE